MSNKEAKFPIPFGVMNGDTDVFIAQEKNYNVKPMKIGDALKFTDDNLSIDAQVYNIALKKKRESVDKYLSQYCTNEKGESMSLKTAIADDWDVVDLKKFIKKLVDISG